MKNHWNATLRRRLLPEARGAPGETTCLRNYMRTLDLGDAGSRRASSCGRPGRLSELARCMQQHACWHLLQGMTCAHVVTAPCTAAIVHAAPNKAASILQVSHAAVVLHGVPATYRPQCIDYHAGVPTRRLGQKRRRAPHAAAAASSCSEAEGDSDQTQMRDPDDEWQLPPRHMSRRLRQRSAFDGDAEQPADQPRQPAAVPVCAV